MDVMLALVLSALIGYLLGTIPTGTLIARTRGVDLRTIGSGRTGATNVLRALGPWAAAAVFIGDFLKGVLAVAIAQVLSGGGVGADGAPWAEVSAATAAIVGHTYSPWLKWRGGRGVVTGMGGLAMIWPLAIPLAFLVGGPAIAVTRYVSLGSIIGTLIAGLVVIVLSSMTGDPTDRPAYMFYALFVPVFIIAAHRDNIVRLLRGTERKLGEK